MPPTKPTKQPTKLIVSIAKQCHQDEEEDKVPIENDEEDNEDDCERNHTQVDIEESAMDTMLGYIKSMLYDEIICRSSTRNHLH